MSENSDTEKARSEIARLSDAAETVLTEAMGIPVRSRWNRNVILDDSFGEAISAIFRPGGTIAVAPHIIRRKFRWRVYLHELCHSFAAPVDRDVYNRMMGWEEGPVEMLQRQIRKEVTRRAGIVCDEAHIALCESFWPYNIYCETLQEMNAALKAREATPFDLTIFYYQLLQTPLGMRSLRLMRKYIADAEAREAIARASGILSVRVFPGGAFYRPLTAGQRSIVLADEAENENEATGQDMG